MFIFSFNFCKRTLAMNIRQQLLKEHSKSNTEEIASYINQNSELFAELMHLFIHDEWIITQRASWVISKCADKYPYLIIPHLEQLVLNLENPTIHVAVKRNTLRVLENVPIPEQLCGSLVNTCFQFLEENEPIAVKAFSITVLANLLPQYPELANELKLILENQLPYSSPGFKHRANKVLKQISRL